MGARVWMPLERATSAVEVCKALGRQYRVAPKTFREDVRAFLEELGRLGVVRRVGEPKETGT